MNPLRIAVIGAGRLGAIHARLLKSVQGAELVAVVDPVDESRSRVAAENGVAPLAEYQALLGKIDAAVVAAPTAHHHRIALDLLSRGIHVLAEKPITATLQEADELVAAAAKRGVVLQVGHVERFNPAFRAVENRIAAPKFIDAVRSSGYTGRSTDIGVVLDLMIHDLDLAMVLAGPEVVHIDALGAAVIGPHEDIANARLTFAGGCVANLTASRASFTAQRTMQVFSREGYAGIDFAAPSATVAAPGDALLRGEFDVSRMSAGDMRRLSENLFTEVLPREEIPIAKSNAILEEQRDFVGAIARGDAPRVPGAHARDVLAVAERILQRIDEHRWDGGSNASGPVGPRFSPSPGPVAGRLWPSPDEEQRRRAG